MSRPTRPVLDRLMERTEIDPITGCWLWTGPQNGRGYGQMWVGNSKLYVHRVSYEEYIGPIPDGLQLDHRCRTRNCLRPGHLEPVTGKVNILRGTSFSAVNARKTKCSKGHEFSRENTWVSSRNRRICRACERERSRIKYARRTARAAA